MIDHISIKDFAIIKDTEIDFEEGLNIITGETGSGKSIVIEAISLALGSRADTTFVRTGCEKAVVQLQGELDGNEIIVNRTVSASGKNLCKLNGQLVTLGQLVEAVKNLADIHGQYDNQSLMDPEHHIELVDQFDKENIGPLKEAYSSLYDDYMGKKAQLSKLLSLEASNKRKLDFYKFEIDEIDKADLSPDEDVLLEERVSLLQNSEKIFAGSEGSYESLAGEMGAISTLGRAMSLLSDIKDFSSELSEIFSQVEDCYYNLEETAGSLRNLTEGLTFTPEELDSSISRLNTIENLKKKYGNSIDEILTYRDNIAEELLQIENFDDEKARLENEVSVALEKVTEAGARLSAARKEAALSLETAVEKELHELNFSNAKLKIQFESESVPQSNGFDKVEILISTNIGESLKPLVKTASGGEISRIMLAIKNITGANDRIPTMIFDEIDAGISGKTAAVVGKKLKEISKEHQIICITHLPQIAAKADHAYKIYKESSDKETFTYVDRLSREEQIHELARLLGGEEISENAIRNAEELIASANE